jgi:hypothetical protein
VIAESSLSDSSNETAIKTQQFEDISVKNEEKISSISLTNEQSN